MILKTKAYLKEGPDNIIVVLGLFLVLIDWLSFGEGGRGVWGGGWGVHSKLDVQGQEAGRILDVDG